MAKATNENANTIDDIQSKFGPVFALKSTVLAASPEATPLDAAQQQLSWDTLMAVVPDILAQCSGISVHPDNEDFPLLLKLWDFFNGREISVSVNKHGGYNLSIQSEEIRWMETQLPLDLLLLKLLALDYTPEEFRALVG
ncbi:hypothetical protein [uncultured Roseobacter sp.]|uniref:hypothetical protein n=1 Tax=uncultured Roseobacter sp. TaxID=114847 RepID=UPI00261D7ED4|nr:hypothetical protein [uncultured Roseobacter sp.]